MTSKKPNPALENFAKSLLEAIAVLAQKVSEVSASEHPEKELMAVCRMSDSITLRLARQAVITAEEGKPQPINPLVEITAINVSQQLRSAARDLESQKALPKTWEDTLTVLKDQAKVAQAMQLLISQVGVSGTVVLPGEPLKDSDGKPLVGEEE